MSYTNKLYSEIRSAEANIKDYENKNTKIQQKIRQLRNAKKEIKEFRKDVNSQRKRINKMSKGLKGWKGSNYNVYKIKIDGQLIEGYKTYNNGLNDVLDSIDDEISRLRNESYRLDGNMESLRVRVNWLYREIENSI